MFHNFSSENERRKLFADLKNQIVPENFQENWPVIVSALPLYGNFRCFIIRISFFFRFLTPNLLRQDKGR